jgi:hypothetical protein
MGLSVEAVRKPPKPVPEEVAKRWAREWAKEDKKIDWQGLMPPQGYWPTPQVGGGMDLLVAGTKQEDEQGLRAALRHRGGVRLCSLLYASGVGGVVGQPTLSTSGKPPPRRVTDRPPRK